MGDRLYFAAYNDEFGEELWSTNGTTDGTLMVLDMVLGPDGSYPNNLTDVNGRLFYSAGYDPGSRSAVWTTDGTVEGTRIILETDLGLFQ